MAPVCLLGSNIPSSMVGWFRAKSTDRDKPTTNQRLPVIASQRDSITVISSQSKGLGKMALDIVKYFYDPPHYD